MASLISITVDASYPCFYFSGCVEKKARSCVNVPFRIGSIGGDEELEKKFLSEAFAKGMIQLKGHR